MVGPNQASTVGPNQLVIRTVWVPTGMRRDSMVWRPFEPIGAAHTLTVTAPALVPVKQVVWPGHGVSRLQWRVTRGGGGCQHSHTKGDSLRIRRREP